MTKPTYREALSSANIAAVLHGLDWAVIGTPPLGLAVEGSDIDIACAAFDADDFAARVWDGFSRFSGFSLRQWAHDPHALICAFHHAGWPFEIFAMGRAVREQAGWRHFDVERRLLRLGGERFRRRVLDLRAAGLKTEPAFASALGLDGDPFRALLDCWDADDAGLEALLEAAQR